MGTPVPPEWPPLIDAKWYCCTMDQYDGDPEVGGCAGPYQGRHNCCALGSTIKAWLDADNECSVAFYLCPKPPFGPQRLVAVHGPYGSLVLCQADCS